MKKPRYVETRKSAIKAIKASIKHWRKDKIDQLLYGGININMTAERCSLCALYYDRNCNLCPLDNINMRCEGKISPWWSWKMAYLDNNKNKELAAAKNMVRVLKSLLPKEKK